MSEMEQWLREEIATDAMEPRSEIIAHSVACINNAANDDFTPKNLPLDTIPDFEFEKVNVSLIAGTTYQIDGLEPGRDYLFTADAEDEGGNRSEKGNVVSVEVR